MRPLLIPLLLCCTSCYGQFNYFVYNARKILSTTDSVFIVPAAKPGPGNVNTYQDSITTLQQLLDYSILCTGKRDTMRCSSILMQLSALTAKRYAGLDHATSSKWTTVRRQLVRSFLGSKCRFGMISVYSFTVPLVKTDGDFYYDKDGPDGEYNLYDGKKKVKPTEENPEPEARALPYYTEAELQKLIDRKMRRTRCGSELRRGLCSYYGYSIAIDRRSLHSGNKVPQARVILILGSKRLKMVRKRA